MNIKGSRVLILGGWGLVGTAICHKIMENDPAVLIVSSLKESEALNAVENLRKEYPNSNPDMFVPKWGNIFSREQWKDISFNEVLSNPEMRKQHIRDIFYELSDDVLNNSALYNLIKEVKPDIVIDCINTATIIAYLNIYNTVINALKKFDGKDVEEEVAEHIIASAYIPQLIRHIQILHKGLVEAGTKMYLKIGTSGTGGMGFNIPYTHSEERPSRVLLSKSAVAGAHTLLLFALARTPNGPIVKEIKPTASIAWKSIAYGDIKRRGQAMELVDMDIQKAKSTDGYLHFSDIDDVKLSGRNFQSVYIDTGENGIFSRGEFQAISSLGQMELVTPEEIAENLIFEIKGGNTGKDVIQGLDAFTMGPTYRGGILRNVALDKLDELEKEYDVHSVAFELLGPPRLSKLLYEAYFLKKIVGNMKNVLDFSSADLSQKASDLIENDEQLRSQILTIGIAILLKDGKHYLRGKDLKIPVARGESKLEFTESNINQWCYDGWIDLRESNFDTWKNRIKNIMEHSNSISGDVTSSRYTYTNKFWDNFEDINPGNIVSWVFEFEDKGWRFKR